MDLAERPGNDFRRHPWELSRLAFFSRVLRTHVARRRSMRVLDVGSGDGWFLTEILGTLPPGTTGVGWDIAYEPANLPRPEGAVAARVHFTPDEPVERFDLLVMLDVLEHVDDATGFLARRVTTNLASGGAVLMSVPAWPALFTSHDTALGHFRRYTPTSGRQLLESCDLQIRKSGGLFHVLTVPRALEKARETLRPDRARTRPDRLEWNGGPVLTALVRWALQMDNSVSVATASAGLQLPGLSFWALCGRRDTT